jgi:2-dehydro-3-deoxygalactonokinase
MTAAAAFIGADWGNSNARFWLIADDGAVLQQRNGAGIGMLANADAIEQACFDHISGWIAANPALPVILVGAVGSNIGWHTAGYAATPAKLADIADGMLMFNARGTGFAIAPGLNTIRSDGLPDVMRGEEIQIFGSMAGVGEAAQNALLCLPGTHSKWACVTGGSVTAFHSAPTGELLDILGRHSILLNPKRPVAAVISAAFQDGVIHARDSKIGLESLLFAVRSRQIAGSLGAEHADSYLAGLVIGCEVKSALALYDVPPSGVKLIGSPHLTTLYAEALAAFAVSGSQSDGDAACLAGLIKLRQMRFP